MGSPACTMVLYSQAAGSLVVYLSFLCGCLPRRPTDGGRAGFFLCAALGNMWDWDAEATWNGAVGKYHTCSVAPDAPDVAAATYWEQKLQMTTTNSSIFGRTQNLYVTDRCFAPRRLCKLRMKSGIELLLPRDGPGQTHLMPGRYNVVLGAAQVLGVVARTSFATILEQQSHVPFVNLGRGAAGPHIYTDPGNWPLLAPIFANARAVVLCVMAGRSSPNAVSGAFNGQAFGAEQLRAFDNLQALERAGHHQRAERHRRESLATAREDSAELLRRIANAARSAHMPPPRILLVWFSGCPLSGCNESW